MLDDKAKAILKDIVCKSLHAALTGSTFAPEQPEDEALLLECGCFVTLTTDGNLRGCLGRFESDLPIYETVSIMTAQSALEDPRFAGNRLSINEIDNIHYDISILTPLEKCDDPENIVLGKHGIYIKSGFRSGCFLPQVATEQGWDIDQFWGYCCSHKAGLSYDAWRGSDVDLYTFTAEVIEGKYQPS